MAPLARVPNVDTEIVGSDEHRINRPLQQLVEVLDGRDALDVDEQRQSLVELSHVRRNLLANGVSDGLARCNAVQGIDETLTFERTQLHRPHERAHLFHCLNVCRRRAIRRDRGECRAANEANEDRGAGNVSIGTGGLTFTSS